MPNIARLERTTRYLVALVASAVLLGAIALLAQRWQQALGYSITLKGPVSGLLDQAIPTTGKELLVGIALALPLGLLFGVVAGLHPGSSLARILETPAILLFAAAALPSGALLLFMQFGLHGPVGPIYLLLIPMLTPLAARAVTQGLLWARTDGRVPVLRAVRGILGVLLRQTGPLLLMVALAELSWSSRGLFPRLQLATVRIDMPMIFWVLAILLGLALTLHLAGELLAPPPPSPEAPRRRLCPFWLTLGALLTLGLPAAAFFPLAALPGRVFRMTDALNLLTRDTRQSLTWALCALAIAAAAGFLLGGIARHAGERGTAILSPTVAPSGLLRALMGGLGSIFLLGVTPLKVAIGIGVAAIPAMAYALRLLLASPSGPLRRRAWRHFAAAACIVLGEALIVQFNLQTLFADRLPSGIGLSSYLRIAFEKLLPVPQLLALTLIPVAGIVGLLLLGHALTEPER